MSDRDGFQHVYRYDYSGKLIQQVTHGNWSVTRIEGTDPPTQTIYFTSTESVAARAPALAGEVRRQRTEAHHDDARDATRSTCRRTPQYFIDTWSSTTQPRQVELWSTDAAASLRTMESNDATTRLARVA